MPVFFNKVERVNPANRAITKWYLILKSLGMVKTKALAKEMADETTMNPKEAEIAIYEMVKVMKRLLSNGYTVQIDDLGSFYLTANSAAADSEAALTASNLSKLNIRFRPAAEFKAEIAKIQLKPASEISKK
ncbi:MAG: HU family DNA-binding protein [Bacteroidales bacterium]|jgi:predicted histone-like DNA-binding protein|nr:HU family DNA-binding protein [Bacteroidales bacterium]